MVRLVAILMVIAGFAATGAARAASAAVDIDTAATLYQAAEIREQVRASLGSMPGQIRKMFEHDSSTKLSDEELAAVTAAAEHGFRIDVFETPALAALAQNLDPGTLAKAEAFLASDLGKRMVAADVASATMGQENIDKVMNGETTAPSTPKRDEIFQKIEKATRSTESTVDIFVSMGEAVAVGTAIGSGIDRASVAERAKKSGDASRAELEASMREPMRRFLAYSYRDMSDDDLKHLLSFLESRTGVRYVAAYNASMGAGYDAMGKRTGERLGESLRELAQAKLDRPVREAEPADAPPPAIAAPSAPMPSPARPPVLPGPASH
jgi:hypothetical protein